MLLCVLSIGSLRFSCRLCLITMSIRQRSMGQGFCSQKRSTSLRRSYDRPNKTICSSCRTAHKVYVASLRLLEVSTWSRLWSQSVLVGAGAHGNLHVSNRLNRAMQSRQTLWLEHVLLARWGLELMYAYKAQKTMGV